MNAYKDDKRKLFDRHINYCDNHSLFLKKFFVPFLDNIAKTDLRENNIKQKLVNLEVSKE